MAKRRYVLQMGVAAAALLRATSALAQTEDTAADASGYRDAPICQGTVGDRHPTVNIDVDGSVITYRTAGDVEGKQIRGVNVRALVTDHLRAFNESKGSGDNAGFLGSVYNGDLRFGHDELNTIKSWGANTLRFQISQFNLSKDSPNYKRCLYNAIRMARNEGLLVILAMQWEKNPKGDVESDVLPTKLTMQAWKAVNDEFQHDKGIIYELFNEPKPSLYSNDNRTELVHNYIDLWKTWLHGDDAKGYIGHQDLVDWMRNELGTKKLLIVDGLDLGGSFEGVQRVESGTDANRHVISDPLHRLAFAVHPYAREGASPSALDAIEKYTHRWAFAAAAYNIPVMVTEWSQGAGSLNGLPAERVVDLINYVSHNKTPFIAGAFDANGIMIDGLEPTTDPQVWQPTTFDSYDPNDSPPSKHAQSGILVCRFFQHGYDGSFLFHKEDVMSKPIDGEGKKSPCQAGLN